MNTTELTKRVIDGLGLSASEWHNLPPLVKDSLVSAQFVAEQMQSEEPGYAEVVWKPEDVMKLRPTMTRDRAVEFLESNEGTLQDRTIEFGWQVIEAML